VKKGKAILLIQEQMRGNNPYSHISSALVHLESHHVAFYKRSPDMKCYKHSMNDAKLVMDNEVTEDKGSSLHLNFGNKFDKLENSSLNIADGFKVFLVILQMHSNSRHKINISYESRVLPPPIQVYL
jgi:hypothetical protein